MVVAKIYVDGTRAIVTSLSSITMGMQGAQVEVEYNGIWSGLNRTAVFAGSVVKDIVNAGELLTIPAELTEKPRHQLRVGFYGVDGDGKVVIPTLWATLGIVQDATDPSGDTSTDPSLPVWAQLLKMYDELQAGAVPHETIKKAVEEYLTENPNDDLEIPEALPNPHKLTFTGAVQAEYDGSSAVTVEIPAGGGGVDLTGYATEQYVDDAINRLSEEMGELSEELEALKVGSAETVKKYINFDEVIPGKVFTSGFPNGASLPAYTSYKKVVTPGDVYYITSCVVQNDGYGVAHFFYDNTFVANAGIYGDVTGYVTDYEVTVPPGANIMYVIPGFDRTLGEYDPKIVPTMWKWEKVDSSPDAKKNTASNYVSFNGTVCIVKAKYNDTEDIALEISPGGGNGLPDIRKIFTTENAGPLDDYTGAKRTLLSSGTDIIAPHVVKAVNNANGDTPDAENFTGGNHQTNNQGSGGAVTARSGGLTVKCDNVSVDGSAWGNVVTVSWTNYIHGYNTSKADGTGREIMKEEVILTISGTRISVDVKHYALEDIVRKTYYGLQMVLNAFSSLRYIGGSNRVANACDAASNSGNKNCRNISLETEDGDVLEIGIDNVDLGDFSQDGATHSAFATSYGKSYFAVILNKEFAQNSGGMTTLRGYHHITSK